MELRLHASRARPDKTRRPAPHGWRAGLPVRRFFTRFGSLSDVPPEDLDILSERIRLALDVSQETGMAALHAAVRAELRKREQELDQ
ncbi:hypothetical protein ABIB27_003406 [Arthrobacter sp. UYEF21]